MSDRIGRGSGWVELDTADVQRGPHWRVAKSLVTVAGEDVLCADDPAGLRHLLVPLSHDAAEILDTRSSGVHLVTRVLVDDAGSHRYLDVACRKKPLTRIFEHLADDILARLRAGETEVATVCTAVLTSWRELLAPELGRLLSTEALAGLFGELVQLRQLCSIAPTLVACWSGPSGARHDFTAPGYAIEVKSTLARNGWRVRIHGLTQLESKVGEVLVLRAFRLEANGIGGRSIPELIDDLVALGVGRSELFGRLSGTGYSAADEDHYRRFRFAVIEERVHRILTDTPCVVSSSFTGGQAPLGVEDIHYTSDLAVSTDDLMNEIEIGETLKAFAESAQHAAGP